ncbi:MAG: hypothetical protein Q8P67_29340, partial [archaeon]|nr:hypothetical protein [archaeon]
VAEGRADRMLELMCAGLAGGPMMRSATLIGLSRLFWEGRHHFSSATMRTLLYAATELLLTHSREVLRADLDFCKVAVVSVDPAILATQLPKLLANLLSRENHDNKLHFQVAIKGVLKRLLRKFSYAELDSHIPPEDRPLLKHLHRAAKRQKRKANERKVASKPKFSGDNETAFTNLLQDSDDESPQQPDAPSSASASSAPGRRSKRSAPRHELEITGEDVDPIDILSSESYAVTSSSSSRVSSNPFQFDASGKLVISNEGSKKRGAPVSLNDDYVDPDVLDSDDDNGGEAPARATDAKRGRTVTSKETKPKRAKPANLESGDRFKNKGGGDKKVGGVDPYAYLRFDPASLNKRKKAQFGGQFKHIMHSKSKKSSRR